MPPRRKVPTPTIMRCHVATVVLVATAAPVAVAAVQIPWPTSTPIVADSSTSPEQPKPQQQPLAEDYGGQAAAPTCEQVTGVDVTSPHHYSETEVIPNCDRRLFSGWC